MSKKVKKGPSKTTFAKGALRRASLAWRPISEARRLARKERGRYECAMCKELFSAKEVQVDHRNPVIDIKEGWQGWDSYIERLFCDVDQLDVLCTTCHDVKSSHEVQMRKYFRAKKKEQNLDVEDEDNE
jgi:5-methylcytosine-specific restriction endonuclease McrA